ncbi:hypothetical protein BGZ95_007624, partial [Linnemannia exigua]
MAYASMGCHLDTRYAEFRKGAYVFRISGQVMHRIGSVIPVNDKKAAISQLHFFDPEIQASLRNEVFDNELDIDILMELERWITPITPFAGVYKTIREMTLDSATTFSDLTFVIRGNINDNNGKRKYQYDKP